MKIFYRDTLLPFPYGVRIIRIFETSGLHRVTLTVENAYNQTATVTEAVTIEEDMPPIAWFSYTPIFPEVNETVTFDASESSDDVEMVNYTWEFGDGSPTGYGIIITHVYETEGDYLVKLTVMDSAGQTDTYTSQVTVIKPIRYTV